MLRTQSGVHSLLPMHTTHKHIHMFLWPEHQSLREAWRYGIGDIPPNYPVPALVREVEWIVTPDHVAVVSLQRSCVDRAGLPFLRWEGERLWFGA